ncbi:MAG: DUF1365 domain-containing protein [Pseudomonadota bacterium]
MIHRVDHIQGTTFHGRKGTIENAFRYSVDYLAIDPEKSQPAPWLFGRNARRAIGIWDKDHGGAPGKGVGASWLRDVLAAHDCDVDGRIELLAQPRVWGHVFNPVSFWLCYSADDKLRVVVAEVSNTYGDRHSYLCRHQDGREITRLDTLHATKIFHVSPFQPITGDYTFRFDITKDRIGIWIEYGADKGGLLATLTGKRRPLRNRSILWMCLRRPFGSRRVLGLIHWQAFKLWWKGASWHVRPEPPKEEVS